MAILQPEKEQFKAYGAGEDRRARERFNKSIPPIFSDAKEKSTDAIIEVLNNRKYLKMVDNKKRARAIARDPKMKQIDGYIKQAGNRSLTAIYSNLDPHYLEEAPMAMKHLYPELDRVLGSFNASLTEKESNNLKSQPIEGRTYAEWIQININNYVTQWESSFRRIMSQNVTTDGYTSRDTQLITSIRKLLNTFESRVRTLFMDAMNNVSRQALYDLQEAIHPGSQVGSPFTP